MKAVDIEVVRKAFYQECYVEKDGNGTAEQRRDAKRKAFSRAVAKAQANHLIGLRSFDDGRQIIWMAVQESAYGH